MVHIRVGNYFLEGVRKVFEDDDCACTRVLQLVPELASRIHRIHVYNDEACAENAAHRHRILQDVGEHYGNPFTARESERLLQETRESHGLRVQVAVGQRSAHIRICRPVGIRGKTVLEQITNGAPRRRRNVLRHTFRIGFQPNFFHGSLSCFTAHQV